jgi:hypothetical protein
MTQIYNKPVKDMAPGKFTWTRYGGYECSSKGDKRFSAFYAVMPDGRTLEAWYQCDVKGYAPGSSDWRLGKGQPPLHTFSPEQLYQLYKSLWQIWALHNVELLPELRDAARAKGSVLSDCFATTPINQARALTDILNEWL